MQSNDHRSRSLPVPAPLQIRTFAFVGRNSCGVPGGFMSPARYGGLAFLRGSAPARRVSLLLRQKANNKRRRKGEVSPLRILLTVAASVG